MARQKPSDWASKQKKVAQDFHKKNGRYPWDTPPPPTEGFTSLMIGDEASWSKDTLTTTNKNYAETPKSPPSRNWAAIASSGTNEESLVNNNPSVEKTGPASKILSSQISTNRPSRKVVQGNSCLQATLSASIAVVNVGNFNKAPLRKKDSLSSIPASSLCGSVSLTAISSSGSQESSFTFKESEAITLGKPEWDDYVESNPPPPKTQKQLENEALKFRLDKSMEGWPWREDPMKGIMEGPFFASGTPFKHPQVKQECAMFRAFKHNSDVKDLVITTILQSHFVTSNFMLTCQEMFTLIMNKPHMWDVARGFFQNCDIYLPENKAQDAQKVYQRPRPEYPPVHVVASAARLSLKNRDGAYYFQEQINHVKNMMTALSNWADIVQSLQLHRVTFLTHQHLALVIPQMRNLKTLGVLKCQLIHIGHAINLLDIIKTDRPLGKENQVSLDFYPNFHVGPEYVPGDRYCVGSYGVTWDNYKSRTTAASCLGIWSLVARILPRARAQGVDFESHLSMFKKWLDDGPCFLVDETLNKLGDPRYQQATAEMLRLEPTEGKDEESPEMQKCRRTLATLVANIDAANMDHYGDAEKFMGPIGNRAEGWKWTVHTYKCTYCKSDQLGIFFEYNQLPGEVNADGVCFGCRLFGYLNREKDHFKLEKRAIIKKWLCPSDEWNLTDLSKAIKDFDNYDILNHAAALDCDRQQKIKFSHDPEFNERQVPRTPRELSQMYSSRNDAVDIEDKKKYLNHWYRIPDTTRRNAHGR